jgi:hypothetical protein
MFTIELKLTIPEGTTITISGLESALSDSAARSPEVDIERYWRDYLSDNARRLFRAAANIESFRGPGYTLEEIAANLSINYESVRSFQQTSGRIARKWREDTGTPAPIQLEWENYEENRRHGGMRTSYHLPPGVADAIRDL